MARSGVERDVGMLNGAEGLGSTEQTGRRAAILPIRLAVSTEIGLAVLHGALQRLAVVESLDEATRSGTATYEPAPDVLPYRLAFAVVPDGPDASRVELWFRSRLRVGARSDLARLQSRLERELRAALADPSTQAITTERLSGRAPASPSPVPSMPGHLSPRYPLDRAVADDLASGVRWGTGQAVLAWMSPLFVAAPLILISLVVHLGGGLATLMGEALMGIFVWIVARRVAVQRGGWSPAFGLRRPGFRDAWTALGWLMLQLLARVVMAGVLLAAMPGLRHHTTSNVPALYRVSWLVIVEYLIAAVAVAPLVEELQFRGVVLRALMRRWRFWPSAVVAGLAFGLLHAPAADNWEGAVYLGAIMALFGLLQAVLVRRKGHLAPAMLVHVMANALALGLAVS